MTDKQNYKSLSLRNYVINKLDNLGKTIFPGYELSRAKTVEILINDRISKEVEEGNTINAINKSKIKKQKY
jgi:hypothetical protein